MDAFTITISHNFPRFRPGYSIIRYQFSLISCFIRGFCGASPPCMHRIQLLLASPQHTQSTEFTVPSLDTGNVII